MARVSSHTLNSVDGSHAAGIKVSLRNLDTQETLFETEMDQGGRLSEEIVNPEGRAQYELVFETGAYWQSHLDKMESASIMTEIVIRFSMPDADGRYHIPLILAPNGYSVWSSTPEG